MEKNKNIILSTSPNIAKYSSNLIKRGFALANDINQYSNYYCEQINQLLEEAEYLYGLEVYRGVLTCSEKMIEINKSCAEAWWYKARSLWKTVDWEEALIAVNKSIALKPNFTQALLTKSAILMNLCKYDEAIKETEEVIKIKPDEYRAWYNKGLIYIKSGKEQKANFAFNQALKIKFNSYKFQKNVNYNCSSLFELNKIKKYKDNKGIIEDRLINYDFLATFDTTCVSRQSDSMFWKDIKSVQIDSNQNITIERNDGITQTWNLKKQKLLHSYSKKIYKAYKEKIISKLKNKTKLLNIETEHLIKVIEDEDLTFFSLSVAPNSRIIAFVGNLCPNDFYECVDILLVFNLSTGKFIYSRCTPYSEDVAFSPDEKLLAQAVEDKPAHIWNAQTGELIRTLDYSSEYPDTIVSENEKGLAFSHDGTILATSDISGNIFLWNINTGKLIQTLSIASSQKFKRYNSISFSQDSKTIVAGDDNGYINVWQLGTESY
ncbi:tetratricopeptide repeat protein [Pleurocapsa sp. FMAR1]|uniref:tetratricopeptide repeat protein n=1 Tax=Pleurocapsa sp. FMAR1 TaxID=3040204 RepID=UPI0029C92F1C|nr:tetratricopeptide repeat protein [Pleurocapsa sp. FMAR1]